MRLALKLALRNLWTDKFATVCAILGVVLGTAIVDVVLIIDESTTRAEARHAHYNPHLNLGARRTVEFTGYRADGTPAVQKSAEEETKEDYEIMRAAIRIGALGAFLIGAMIVFFTFSVIIERRKRSLALLNSLGTTRSQITQILLLEALLIGLLGAVLGLLISIPLAAMAAVSGITTTGRTVITRLALPYGNLLMVAATGTLSAMLAIAQPIISVRKLRVSETLVPRFLSSAKAYTPRARTNLSLFILPMLIMGYILLRPFLQSTFSSLNFFFIEVFVLFGVLGASLWLIPGLIRSIGTVLGIWIPHRSHAHRFLVLRRIQTQGQEVAWSVAGLMLVFGTLLGLHLMTTSLKDEVHDWSQLATQPYWFIYTYDSRPMPNLDLPEPQDDLLLVPLSQRTPWPNSALSVAQSDLQALAQRTEQAQLMQIASAFLPGTTILSTMLAKRQEIDVGDFLEIESNQGSKKFRVIAVTDKLGYVPTIAPYRNGRTYALINAEDHRHIEDFARPPGAALIISDPNDVLRENRPWSNTLQTWRDHDGVFVSKGNRFARHRIEQTGADFLIFDWLIAFTSLLAAIGIANQMMLSAHIRRKELALFKTLGMTKAQLAKMFLVEGALVGILGGLLALVLGYPLGRAAVETLQNLSAFELNFRFVGAYALWVPVAAVALSSIAAMVPAYRALNQSSSEAMNYE